MVLSYKFPLPLHVILAHPLFRTGTLSPGAYKPHPQRLASAAMMSPRTFMVGEALAHVQGFGLKAIAAAFQLPGCRVIPAAIFIKLVREYDMEQYNFWRDVLDTYQSFSDWLKFAWLIVPPLLCLGSLTLTLHYRLTAKRIKSTRPPDDPAGHAPGKQAHTL